MMDQSVTEAIAKLRGLEEKKAALYHAMSVINYDAFTVAPKDTAEGRGRTMGVLSGMEYELTTGAETVAVLDVLAAHTAELDEQTAREVQLMKKANEQISRIPAAEYTAYSILINDAQSVWERAKNEDDFAAFEPYLEKIGVACPKCGKEIVLKKTKKGRKYYGCEDNPDCDFMSWQKPSAKKCPKCGSYMVEKGNKLVCSQETCGYVEAKDEKE